MTSRRAASAAMLARRRSRCATRDQRLLPCRTLSGMSVLRFLQFLLPTPVEHQVAVQHDVSASSDEHRSRRPARACGCEFLSCSANALDFQRLHSASLTLRDARGRRGCAHLSLGSQPILQFVAGHEPAALRTEIGRHADPLLPVIARQRSRRRWRDHDGLLTDGGLALRGRRPGCGFCCGLS